MSIENKSPEINNRSEKAINADIVELGLKEYYLAEKLNPGSPVEIPKLNNSDGLLQEYQNEERDVYQGLLAELRVGDEILGIVNVFVKTEDGIMDGIAVTRNIQNQQAELIGFVNPNLNKITEIGREHNKSLDNSVSRNHLALSYNNKGGVNIMDMGSTNGTLIFRHNKPGLKNIAIDNPANNVDNWSIDSAEIKKTMQNMLDNM
jgi:hypothetical protein